MFECDKYLGHPYDPGVTDCFSLLRNYYRDRWGIHVPNFARPTNFWADPNLDLYAMYRRFGFEPVFDRAPQVGDLLLFQIGSQRNSHGAVVVEDGQILHHLPNQLSCLDPLFPKWQRRANIIASHPAVRAAQKVDQVELHEVLNADVLRDPRVRQRLEAVLDTE